MFSRLLRIGNQVQRLAARASNAQLVVLVQHIEQLRSRYQEEKRLEPSGFKVYSQGDEDGIIDEIFRRIGTANKRFIEFGCGSGQENNSAFLLLKGWRGFWLDASETNEQMVKRLWAAELNNGNLRFERAFVTPADADARFRDAGFSGEIDFLSIDIDGNDFYIWESLSDIKPRVVCIEYNPKFPPPLDWVMPRNDKHQWDGSDWHGASLSALERLGREKGYALVGCSLTGANAFFVRNDLAEGNFAQPATAEHLYQPARFYIIKGFESGHPPRD